MSAAQLELARHGYPDYGEAFAERVVRIAKRRLVSYARAIALAYEEDE